MGYKQTFHQSYSPFQKIQPSGTAGFGLIEVLVAMGVLAVLAGGIVTVVHNMMEIHQRNVFASNLTILRENLRTSIENDTAWANSIQNPNNNGRLDCLRETHPTGCTDAFTSSFLLYNMAEDPANAADDVNTLVYDGTVDTNGFTMEGAPCNTFINPPAVGTNACPLRYVLSWTANCSGGASPCKKPNVRVQANLIFNPQSVSASLRTLNLNNYSLDVNRGVKNIRYEPIEIRHFTTDAPPGAGNIAEGGTCNPGNWTTRKLNDLVYDSGGNVASLAGSAFTLRAGTYDCTIRAQHWGTGGYKVRLNGGSAANTFYIGGDIAGPGAASNAQGKARFSITADTTFTIETECEVSSGPYDLGIPVPTYSNGNSFSSVSCVRTS